MPRNRFSIIYADPPWNYRDKAAAGKRGASFKYPVLSPQEIARLPVLDIAANNCALFCWATAPMIADALWTIERWGFEYKTIAFVWVKSCRRATEKDFVGMGNYTRANAEFCLLAIRGRLKRASAAVRQVIRRPVMRHSEKPPEVRDRIVELLGDVSRVELFARQRVDGWAAWGNEIESDDIGLTL